MSSRLEAVTFDAADPATVSAFWAGLLSRDVVAEAGGSLVSGDATQVGLRFVSSDTEQVDARQLHLHLTSTTVEDQQRTVSRALQLGGAHLDVGQAPEDEFVVLADPEGNELCVIEPRNGFLSGTGFLGEVTCEGTREVGLFWSEALGWPLVWDEDGETAVQSPLGGTKVSWGGPPISARAARNRQRLDLVTDDVEDEVVRLVSLGATRLRDRPVGVELADPDGNEFGLRST